MEGQDLIVYQAPGALSFTLRDVAMVAFRRRRMALLSFFGVLLGTILYGVFWPKYKSETEILVRRDRVDPVITSQQTNPVVVSDAISEEEMNSEVELIKSQDVLRKIVIDCGLDQLQGSWLFGHRNPEKQIARAIEALRSNLFVEALTKSNIIRVTFISRDPKLAARVLTTLDSVYLEEHRALHSPAGEFAFFDQQGMKAKQDLDAAEMRLKGFPSEIGIANPTLDRDITLQKLGDLNANLGATKESIAETQKRIDALEQLTRTTPARLATQERQADDGLVLQQLETTLLNLELKHSDMISKYQADYRPVQELEREIAETRAAIAAEKPLSDNTTDQNPTYVWIKSELAKAHADLQGYQAKATETEAIIGQTQANVRQLDEDSVEQQNLQRTAKAAEENYLLYLHKREEARITDALDQSHILNVAVAEKPTVPVFPAQSRLMFGLFGMVLALAASAGTVFALESLDSTLRTPAEVQALLSIPVLATFPDQNSSANLLPHRNAS
jgi:uncharacterized protein involved in exopolysaccharide biosynthesis